MERQTARERESSSLWAQYVKIFGAVTLYWTCSISMVFVNNHVLSNTLDAPMFVTWFQCFVSVALCALFGYLAKMFPNHVVFPEFKIDQKLSREVLPLSFVFVGMITFNNLCLKNVGVAFYFLGRSLTTVFNVICVYLILGEKTVKEALFWCGVIIFGFWLGVDQENMSGKLSVSGVIFGVLASLCVALNAIFMKKVLPNVGDNLWRLCLYNNLNACVIFIPFIIFNGDISTLLAYEDKGTIKFWLMLSLSGILGFGMGYVTGLQIQVTSPLTHNISGTAKAAAQTVIAVTVDGAYKTMFWWCSNLVVLIGSAGYTWTKQRILKQNHSNKSINPNSPSQVKVDKVPLMKMSDNDEESV